MTDPWPALRLALVALAVAILVGMSGCGEQNGRLNSQGDKYPLKCLDHQTERPGRAYAIGGRGDTVSILRLLRYYTANGNQPYCDRRGPTETDRVWARRYVELGADQRHVRTILG